MALFLPGRAHDALNRLLRVMPLSTRALMRLLIAWVGRRYGQEGYLCLDDVVIEKAFAKRLLWRAKRSCAPGAYHTKLKLAEIMLKEVLGSGLKARYIVFHTHYSAGWFTKTLTRMSLVWVGTLHPRTIVYWRGKRCSVGDLAGRLPLKWRKRLGVRATTVRLYAPKYGSLRLVVTRNRHSNHEYILTNELEADLSAVVLRKVSRWQVETRFRDTKQYAGLEACQCRVDQAMVRHVGLVLLTFVVLQMMRRSVEESLGSVKERWQLEVMRDSESPPPLLKACPPHLRATA